jgi:hypothetical protein
MSGKMDCRLCQSWNSEEEIDSSKMVPPSGSTTLKRCEIISESI